VVVLVFVFPLLFCPFLINSLFDVFKFIHADNL